MRGLAVLATANSTGGLVNATRGVPEAYHSSISCYGIPYGWIGTLSHVLLYYSFFMVCLSVKPLMPWKPLSVSPRAKAWDVLVAVGSICGTVGAGIWGMVRCDLPWPVLLLATSKVGLAVSCSIAAIVAIRSARIRVNLDYEVRTGRGCWAIALYMPFVIVGLIGGVPLAKQVYTYSSVFEKLTAAFCIVGVVCGIYFVILTSALNTCFQRLMDRLEDACGFCLSSLVPLGLWLPTLILLGGASLFIFWVDWLVAFAIGDMTGLPDGHIVVAYWIYFWARKFTVLVW